MDGEILEQNLKCPICLSMAEDPWESSCCGHLFCNRCIKLIKSKTCPICRTKKTKFRENSFARILLNNVLVKCPYGCEISTSLSNLKLHRYQCEFSIFKCSIRVNNIQCNFEGNKKDSLQHFKEKHCDHIVLLAEHYPSVKNTYDKSTIIEKYNKNKTRERDLNKKFGIIPGNREINNCDKFYENYLNYKKNFKSENNINLPINTESRLSYKFNHIAIDPIKDNHFDIRNIDINKDN